MKYILMITLSLVIYGPIYKPYTYKPLYNSPYSIYKPYRQTIYKPYKPIYKPYKPKIYKPYKPIYKPYKSPYK